MCEPMTIMAGLAMASTAFSLNEQRNQQGFQEDVAKNNAEWQNNINDQNYKQQARQMGLQQIEEDEATATAKLQQRLDMQKAVAERVTSSGESGVAGLSIDSLFADVMRQGSNNITTLERNQRDSQSQRSTELKTLQNNTWAGIQNPSFYKGGNQMLGAGLQIASAGAGAWSQGGGSFQAPRANGKWQNPFVGPKKS